jgi:hypothetical protein
MGARVSASRLAARAEAATEAEVVRDTLLEPGQAMVVPAGDSAMRPCLVPGDLIEVAPFLGLPRPGQIVVARVSGNLTTRRLAGVEMIAGRRRYRLRGDAVPEGGEGVRREDLLGRVVAVVRHGRRMSMDDRLAVGPEPVRR